MYNQDSVKDKILELHTNDEIQTSIIFDEAQKIIVEAPAGCGKTKTMISKIAYMIAMNKLESTKRILALTFSVNASYKIKKDVFEQLPKIIECDELQALDLVNKIIVSNYHGFCRKILSKYGYIVSNKSINYNTLVAVSDSDRRLTKQYQLKEEIFNYLNEFSSKIKENDENYIKENYLKYNEFIKSSLLINGIITHNAILTLTYELLLKNNHLKVFYQKYFPVIFIDEFQDTNCLSWLIIKELTCDDSKLIFMGDSLQRIYGFIGAVPNLMNLAEKELEMRKFELKTNYRFKENMDMLILDNNIRLNAKNKDSQQIVNIANPDIIITDNQEEEAKWICNTVKKIMNEEKIAILTRTGINSPNTQKIKEKLDENNIDYFFALFTDEDENYINFHEVCLINFNSILKDNKTITIKVMNRFYSKITSLYCQPDSIEKSLLKLLEIFCIKVFDEYKNFHQEEKIRLIRETFENRALKQSMDKIDEMVILATIHASKGLEFENVIMTDNEKDNCPSYFICKECYQENKNNYCVNKFISSNEKKFIEELSVFYVGFTRAKKKIYFTMSKKSLTPFGEIDTVGSCFLKLKGIGRDNLIRIKGE